MLSVPPFQHPFPTIPNTADLRADGPPPPDPQAGPFKTTRFPRASTNGGGTIAKAEDGERCVVSGRECKFPLAFVGSLFDGDTFVFVEALRILKVITPEEDEMKKTGPSGLRVEASRNFWEGSGLKIDSSSTDVVWGHGGGSYGQGRPRS